MDNRTFNQFRDLQVNFGKTFGSCYVQLGNTIIFASTEAKLDEPRFSRPSEGRFKVTINIAAGGKEKWVRNIERSQPKEAILTTRLLEKTMNHINVLDLESLCLIAGKSVWCIHTKLVLLNYDGNLIESASIAVIASLMHFKRPDATVTPDGDIIIYSFNERNPIPLTLFYYPICVTFQFMDHTHLKKILSDDQEILIEKHKSRVKKASQLIICDPTEEEEDFLHNALIICANVYKEIVAIQSIGLLSLTSFSKQLLNTCSKIAFERVKFVTDYLKKCLEKHSELGPYNCYDFHQAMKNGDLCFVNNYEKYSLFEPKQSFSVSEDAWCNSTDKTELMNEDNDEDDNEDFENDEEEMEPAEVCSKSYSDVIGKQIPIKSKLPEVKKTQIIVKPINSNNNSKKKAKNNPWIVVENKDSTKHKETNKKSNKKKKKTKAEMKEMSDDEEEVVVPLNWKLNK